MPVISSLTPRSFAAAARGATLGEYTLILALIVIVAISGVQIVTHFVSGKFETATTAMGYVNESPAALSDGTFVVPGGPAEEVVDRIDDLPILLGSGGEIEMGSSSSITVPILAGTEEGDLLVAFVMHRDTLTWPAGWSRTGQQFVQDGLANQSVSVLTKSYTASDGDAVSFIQARADALNAIVFTIRGNAPSVLSYSGAPSSGKSIRSPASTSPADNVLLLAAATEAYAYSDTETEITMSPPDRYVLLSLRSSIGNRLSVAAGWASNAGDAIPEAAFYRSATGGNSRSKGAGVLVMIR